MGNKKRPVKKTGRAKGRANAKPVGKKPTVVGKKATKGKKATTGRKPPKKATAKGKSRGFSLRAWISRFDRAMTGRGYTATTMRQYRLRLGLFADWLEKRGVVSIEAVTPELVGDYQVWQVDGYRKKTGGRLSTGTQAQRLAAVRALFRWLFERGKLATDPTAELQLPVKPKSLPRNVPTVAEISRILRKVLRCKSRHRLRDAAIIGVGFASGCRRSELVRLAVGDVDLDKREVRVEKAKNRLGRVSFLTPWARTLLRAYLTRERPDGGEALFVSSKGNALSEEQLGRLVIRHFSGVKGKHVTAHSLRHAFCLALLRGGANLRVVQELAGHQKMRSTTIYTKLELSDLRKVHRRCFGEASD